MDDDAVIAGALAAAFGSPTLFVGEEIFFGKDKLRDAIEAAQR